MPPITRDDAQEFLAAQKLATRGAPLERAKAVLIMLHGRGASAESILGLADVFAEPEIAFLAPQAPGSTWYPYSFLAPTAQNEPHLSRALERVAGILTALADLGVPSARLGILGFSQGACLALESVARNPGRAGAVLALSGGLIGPQGTARDYAGDFAGTRVFLGCSDIDPHIPLARVEESDAVFRRLGADVTTRIYPGFGHAVNDDEIAHSRAILKALQA
jgi:predicted esterase